MSRTRASRSHVADARRVLEDAAISACMSAGSTAGARMATKEQRHRHGGAEEPGKRSPRFDSRLVKMRRPERRPRMTLVDVRESGTAACADFVKLMLPNETQVLHRPGPVPQQDVIFSHSAAEGSQWEALSGTSRPNARTSSPTWALLQRRKSWFLTCRAKKKTVFCLSVVSGPSGSTLLHRQGEGCRPREPALDELKEPIPRPGVNGPSLRGSRPFRKKRTSKTPKVLIALRRLDGTFLERLKPLKQPRATMTITLNHHEERNEVRATARRPS